MPTTYTLITSDTYTFAPIAGTALVFGGAGTGTATPLAIPQALEPTTTSATSLGWQWGTVTNASGYRLQRATVASNGTIGAYATVYSGAAANYTNTGLTSSTRYAYRVLALGTGSYTNSDYSAPVQASTTAGSTTPGTRNYIEDDYITSDYIA